MKKVEIEHLPIHLKKRKKKNWHMIVFRLLGAWMSYQNARVKWSELNLMLPCAIFFQFHSRVWKTLKNRTLLLPFHRSGVFIPICFITEEAAVNHPIVQLGVYFAVLPLVFLLSSSFCISCEASLEESTLEHTLNPKIFLFVILQCVHKKKKQNKKTVPGLDRASANVCFKTAAHKLKRYTLN